MGPCESPIGFDSPWFGATEDYSIVLNDFTTCDTVEILNLTINSCGCTDSLAVNYDVNANVDDGSCLFSDCNGDISGFAFIDSCGNCVSGNTGAVACISFSPTVMVSISDTACSSLSDLIISVSQDPNEPDMLSSLFTANMRSFDISNMSVGNIIGSAVMSVNAGANTFNTNLIVTNIVSFSEAVIQAQDVNTGLVLGSFTIENTNPGFSISTQSIADGNNVTGGNSQTVIFSNVFVNPSSDSLVFTTTIDSELGHQDIYSTTFFFSGPELSIVSVNHPDSLNSCDGWVLVATNPSTVDTNLPFTYQWYDMLGNSLGTIIDSSDVVIPISSLCNDLYFISVTDNLGCSALDSIVLGTIAGCTDSLALNYYWAANIDDGSCIYPVQLGCTDSTALNYDLFANTDDGSCTYCDLTILQVLTTSPSTPFVCDGILFVYATSSNLTIQYNTSGGVISPNGTFTNLCTNSYLVTLIDAAGCSLDTSVTIGTEILGCTDSLACNYNILATTNDSTCIYPSASLLSDTACSSYIWNGMTYTASGIYNMILLIQ